MQLSLPLKALQTHFLKKFQLDSLAADYKKWRHRFLLERLHLTVWIAVIAYPTFFMVGLFIMAALNATGDPTKAVSQEHILLDFIQSTAIELCLVLCLLLLRTSWARRYPALLFLSFSWSVTILPQIQATLREEAQLDFLGWIMVFLIQGTLIPVRWRLHLVSQLSVFVYYFGVNSLLGLNNPAIQELSELIYAQLGITFFWVCLICNLGVYLYERLQQSEFESRTQLRVFLHAVSHDLRNPVLGTLMVLKNLLQQPGEKVQVSRSILERITHSSDRQLELINSLIDTHDAEIRGVVLHCQPLQLSPLVQSALSDLQPMLTKEQAHLTNLIQADLPLVNADPLQLSRVYQNLIANALKHNPPKLTITLDAQPEGDWVRCTVSDTGVGMSEQQREKLFDLYFRGYQQRQSVGLGLGLYLCRQIITAHGGEIGVNSRPGEGATFWFTLPLAISPNPNSP